MSADLHETSSKFLATHLLWNSHGCSGPPQIADGWSMPDQLAVQTAAGLKAAVCSPRAMHRAPAGEQASCAGQHGALTQKLLSQGIEQLAAGTAGEPSDHQPFCSSSSIDRHERRAAHASRGHQRQRCSARHLQRITSPAQAQPAAAAQGHFSEIRAQLRAPACAWPWQWAQVSDCCCGQPSCQPHRGSHAGRHLSQGCALAGASTLCRAAQSVAACCKCEIHADRLGCARPCSQTRMQVHKFGGTCLSDAERITAAARLIADSPAESTAVVVSAMGSHPSAPVKVTDLLLNMVSKAAAQDQVSQRACSAWACACACSACYISMHSCGRQRNGQPSLSSGHGHRPAAQHGLQSCCPGPGEPACLQC